MAVPRGLVVGAALLLAAVHDPETAELGKYRGGRESQGKGYEWLRDLAYQSEQSGGPAAEG
ncbi:hypothetical protein [Nocardia sp. CA-119907]|uniref:hypothetical protein n=1 Tax=Nocardia sp. CA-119907 TaxID=3239973 RepID=UPI003D993D64